MTVRVVLLAEGAGETGGTQTLLPAAGDTLTDAMLGPAHSLVRRAVAQGWSVPAEAVRFEVPLRTTRGTIPRGSELLDRGTLRRVLLWARPTLRPDLNIVLVDADAEGATARRDRLTTATQDLPGVRVIAVAVREFEAWLLADADTLRSVTGGELCQRADLDGIQRRCPSFARSKAAR